MEQEQLWICGIGRVPISCPSFAWKLSGTGVLKWLLKGKEKKEGTRGDTGGLLGQH